MKVSLYSEKDIVAGCQKGKRQFQELLYRQFAQKMYGICLSYAGDRAMAQDMLQESFIKVFKNIGNYDFKGSLEGWIRRVVVNTAIDCLRKQKSITNFIDDKPLDSGKQFYENEAISKLQLAEIIQFINLLPEGARIIFNLFAVEGFSHKEIADQLHISVGTSKSQYNRARTLLQEWLGNYNFS